MPCSRNAEEYCFKSLICVIVVPERPRVYRQFGGTFNGVIITFSLSLMILTL